MLLALRFRPRRGTSSPYQVAAVLEDLEALYLAVPRAARAEEPVHRHLVAVHRARLEEALGLSEPTLGEIEYQVRAIQHLESLGADERTISSLRAAARLLAESEVERVYSGRLLTEGRRELARPLEVRRLSMASPLELVVGIPAEYWGSTGVFLLFLAAIERRFNMIGRIRTEKADLAALRAERRADEREAEVRGAVAERALAAIRERETEEDETALLEGVAPAQQQFELEAGELLPDGYEEGARSN